jgi:plastocyanin
MSRPIPVLVFAALSLAPLARAHNVEVIVRDAAGRPVADAVVYAMPASGTTEVRAARQAEIAQRDREFVPGVTVVQTGTTITFPNQDPILHHVYSFSPAKSFEIKLYSGRSPTEVVFDKPGLVTVGCNIHDWMTAYVMVVSTPYFGKSGADGVVRLRDLAAGGYELRAWHPQQRSAVAAQRLSLEGTAPAKAEVAMDLAPKKARFKPPLDRLKY